MLISQRAQPTRVRTGQHHGRGAQLVLAEVIQTHCCFPIPGTLGIGLERQAMHDVRKIFIG